MKFCIDHDLHIHSHLSLCSHDEEQTPARSLEYAVKNELGCKVRSIELNLCQRCAAHLQSAVDVEESLRVGRGAVNAAIDGVSRVMMGIQRVPGEAYATEIDYSDISKIANMIRAVPDKFINAVGNNVTDECARYLLPLIAGNTEPRWENGMPVYCII